MQQAVALLGSNAVCSLVLSFSLLLLKVEKKTRFDHTRFWERSLAGAAAAMAIARQVPGTDKEEIFIAGLLQNIGNIYYDAQLFPTAIDYYQRALKAEPANTGVRTDMATAYWYTGDADTAIAEFQKSLSYEPTKANTLFNLGIVEWQGKMDIDKATAAWQKLLDTNPNYEAKDKVLELMAQAKKHSGVKPGTPAKPLQ